jgi:P27 family predicted phage terminase small subunit
MPGRKAHPAEFMLLKNKDGQLTKEELGRRMKNEPKPNSFNLYAPSWLGDEAKKEWHRIVRLYKGMKPLIISDLDINALAVYCEAVATYRKAMMKVREQSEVYATRKEPDKARKNPWLIVANEAAMQIKKLGEVLLLDPVSRARAGMAETEHKELSPMAAFLAKRYPGV